MGGKINGGHAFPTNETDEWAGMSLRDYFASHAPNHRVDFPSPAMAAEFAGVSAPAEGDIEAYARLSAAIQTKLAFIYADAMLAERSK